MKNRFITLVEEPGLNKSLAAFEIGDQRFLFGDLLPGQVPHLGFTLAAEHLPGLFELGPGRVQLPEGLDDRLELGVALAGGAGGVLVARGVDVGQTRLERVELGFQVGEALEHGVNPNGRAWGRGPKQEPALSGANGTKERCPFIPRRERADV